jgi:hypothetical protein
VAKRKAIEAAFGPAKSNFLDRFKSFGWYLDDLVLEPVNHLKPGERRAACLRAQNSLAARIAEYEPEAMVVLLKRIRHEVTAAAKSADSKAPLYIVSFPGFGQQGKFQREIADIISQLPRHG